MNAHNRKKRYRPQGAEASPLAQRLAVNSEAGIAELSKMTQRIELINTTRAGMSLDQRAGLIIEEFHAGRYNAAARKAGDYKTTALTGNAGGFANDPRSDIRVVQGDAVIAEAQAKCYRSAGRSAVASARSKYSGTQRILPADQVPAAREALVKSAKAKAGSPNPRMREIGVNRQEAAGKVTATLKAAGHESRPITRKQALELASGDTSSLTRSIASERVVSAATSAAKAGAAVSVAVSTVSNLGKLAKGEISAAGAAKSVLADGAKGGMKSAATAVAAEGVKLVAKRALPSGCARAFVAGAGPMAVAGCAAELAIDAFNGELTIKKSARSVTRAAGGWAGAEGGALLGSAVCPGIGTLIGAVLGGIGGSLLGGAW